MPADLAEFRALSRPKRPKCAVAVVLLGLELEKPERAQLVAACALDVNEITNQAISLWLAKRGVSVTWQKVRTHRRGECSCA